MPNRTQVRQIFRLVNTQSSLCRISAQSHINTAISQLATMTPNLIYVTNLMTHSHRILSFKFVPICVWDHQTYIGDRVSTPSNERLFIVIIICFIYVEKQPKCESEINRSTAPKLNKDFDWLVSGVSPSSNPTQAVCA